MRHSKGADIAVWVLLGASFTLMMVLAMSTWHYRQKIRTAKNKERNNQDKDNERIGTKDARNQDYSGSTQSQHSLSDFQEQSLSMPRRSLSYNSCENLLQGMPSTQHVEIG